MGFLTGVISLPFLWRYQFHPPTPTPPPTWMDFPKARQRHIDTWKTGGKRRRFVTCFATTTKEWKTLRPHLFLFIQVFTYKYFTWGKWCLVKDRYLMSRLAWTRLLQYFFECSLCSFCFKTQVFSKESHCRLLFHFTWWLPNVKNISSAHLSFCLKVAPIFTTIIVMLR